MLKPEDIEHAARLLRARYGEHACRVARQRARLLRKEDASAAAELWDEIAKAAARLDRSGGDA
jgi:hypothetical protein